MTIGFDAKRLFFNHTGLGVYSRLLVKGMSNLDPDMNMVLFAKNARQSGYFSQFDNLKIVSSPGFLWRSWRMTGDIVKNRCDLYHGLSHELPYGIHRSRVKTLVTIHDVIFQLFPGLYPWLDRKVYHQKWKYSSRVANRIVAVSKQTKEDLCRFYEVEAEKISIIPPPVDMQYLPVDIPSFIIREKLPEKFFLFVGALNRRKNISLIMEALNILQRQNHLPLIIIGTGTEKEALIKLVQKYHLSGMVYFKDYVPQEMLPAYYQAATALIYPSIYEGFGIPIVEALRNKIPVITSNISSMPEAAGPGGLLIDPGNPGDLAQAMLQIQEDKNLRRDLIEKGYQHSLKFLPEVICNRQLALYREILEKEKAGK